LGENPVWFLQASCGGATCTIYLLGDASSKFMFVGGRLESKELLVCFSQHC
jgi:hypothetical protein